jgi:hypothetical protein
MVYFENAVHWSYFHHNLCSCYQGTEQLTSDLLISLTTTIQTILKMLVYPLFNHQMWLLAQKVVLKRDLLQY